MDMATIERGPLTGRFEGSSIRVTPRTDAADAFDVAVRTTDGRYVTWGSYWETPSGIFASPLGCSIQAVPCEDDCDAWRTIIRLYGAA